MVELSAFALTWLLQSIVHWTNLFHYGKWSLPVGQEREGLQPSTSHLEVTRLRQLVKDVLLLFSHPLHGLLDDRQNFTNIFLQVLNIVNRERFLIFSIVVFIFMSSLSQVHQEKIALYHEIEGWPELQGCSGFILYSFHLF